MSSVLQFRAENDTEFFDKTSQTLNRFHFGIDKSNKDKKKFVRISAVPNTLNYDDINNTQIFESSLLPNN